MSIPKFPNTTKQIFLIRGLPGAGKTELAKHIAPSAVAADDFMYVRDDETGRMVYEWSREKLHSAHMACQGYVRQWMESSYNGNIAVHNTFTRQKELKPYLELAKKYGYVAHVMTVENYHGNENTHDVPQKDLDRMRNRYQVKLL